MEHGYAPRYSAYCAAHGFDHAGMLEHDRKRSPGGVNAPLMLWISERWREWDARRPEGFAGDGVHRSDAEHAAFDAWLWERVRSGSFGQLSLFPAESAQESRKT